MKNCADAVMPSKLGRHVLIDLRWDRVRICILVVHLAVGVIAYAFKLINDVLVRHLYVLP